MVAILEKRKLRDFDWLLTLLALAIALFGTWMIYNAQPDAGYWKKQIIGLGINGQRCWIGVPGIGQFQPSEFMKIPTVLMLARYYGRPRGTTLTFRQMLMGGAILALPVGLILLEPDSGQALTYFPLLAVVLFLSSVRMWLVVAALVLGTAAVPAAWVVGVKTGAVKAYQQERINVILDPENADRRGIGYHTWQSILTVGEGGLFGSRASVEHSQSGLKFLPEPHTDFIYAVLAEN